MGKLETVICLDVQNTLIVIFIFDFVTFLNILQYTRNVYYRTIVVLYSVKNVLIIIWLKIISY